MEAGVLREDDNGVCRLLFGATKRSGAFPPYMPAGLKARVSRLEGFTWPFSGVIITPPSSGPDSFSLRTKQMPAAPARL
jgi:hypothetical protein